MRQRLTQLFMLGLFALPLAQLQAQAPGQAGEQPPYSASLGPGYIAELTKRESEERRQIMTLSKRLGPEHPTVEDLKRQLEFTQNELQRLNPEKHALNDETSFDAELATLSERQIRQGLASLVKTLRESDDEEKRTSAKVRLGELLRFQLAEDLARREKQLEAAEEKLTKLREQLNVRKQNQDKVADVLLLMIENPEAGVGISSEWLRAIMPTPRPAPNPFGGESDPFGSSPGDPFGGSASADPFGGPSSGGDDDPFGGPASSDPFGGPPAQGSDPFGDSINKSTNTPFSRDPMDAAAEDPFGTPSPAYEVSVAGRDISVYETYDKGIPILTREQWKIGIGESQEISASSVSSIWMTKKGIVEIVPHPSEEGTLVVVGLKKGRVQIALHPNSNVVSQGIDRINVDVTELQRESASPVLPAVNGPAR